MGLDIKIPIGLMFTIFGLLFTIFGLVTNGDIIYEQSLGHNINLWSGIFMLIFGGIMLGVSNLFKKKDLKEKLKQ